MFSKRKDGLRIPIRRVHRQEADAQPDDEVLDSHVNSNANKSMNPEDNGSREAEVYTAANNTEETDVEEWRETALRLKADMLNYRKRQDRWAKDEIQREQDRLLLGFVGVLDDLEQGVKHLDPNDVTHQGVKIAYDNMLHFLDKQGVERINAQNTAFDPKWHEAVAMVPGSDSQNDSLVVAEVVNHGYRIGNRLLRPSRVVVSKRRF